MSSEPLKNPLYENCIVRNMNGELMFRSNEKRAMWYVQRNLATIINQNPLEIQLNFEPKGNGRAEDEYYLQQMQNICVSCGKDNNLNRHHIVPVCFRKWFPEDIKNHSHYDIVLLCVDCHERYERHSYNLKRKLALEFDAPLDGIFDKENRLLYRRAYQAANSLLNFGEKIPEDRKEFLYQNIKAVYGNDFDLEQVANNEIKVDIITQGEIIVGKLSDINSFIRRWRKHFLDTMKPKFLPINWTVNRIKK